jgi:hypothetical protein
MLDVKTTLSAISGVILGTSIGCPTVLAQTTGSITTNAIAGPLPPPKLPPNEDSPPEPRSSSKPVVNKSIRWTSGLLN